MALAAGGYVTAVAAVMAQEAHLVLRAAGTLGSARPPFPYEQIDLPRSDGARQFAWVMPAHAPDAGSWVLYLHGNPSTLASPVNIGHYELLRGLGLNVLAPEYRGFAGLEGVPTEESLAADARAAYDYLVVAGGIPPSHIVLYGWSLGAAVAIDLAASAPVAALITEGAPASMMDLAERRYPFVPFRLLMPNRFDALAAIGRVTCPVLILQSPQDSVVPFTDGRRLFERARSPKALVEVRGGHLQAVEADRERMSRTVRSFLHTHGWAQPGQGEQADGAQSKM